MIIFANPGAGIGPIVRVVELACHLREQSGDNDISILVPDLYGEKQNIILQELLKKENISPDKILLSKELGKVILKVYNKWSNFDEVVKLFAEDYAELDDEFKRIFSRDLKVESLSGNKSIIKGSDIKIEVSRNPVLKSLAPYSVFTSIAPLTDMFLECNKDVYFDAGGFSRYYKAYENAKLFENSYSLKCIPYLSAFSYKSTNESNLDNVNWTPPLIPELTQQQNNKASKKIYVSVSGIKGLDNLYKEIFQSKYKISTNKKDITGKNISFELPEVIQNSDIHIVFARAAWNTIWLANLSNSYLICPAFTKNDSPEVYFNHKSIAKHQLGTILGNEFKLDSLIENFMQESFCQRPQIYNEMYDKFNTFDGLKYVAKLAIKDINNGK